MNPFFQKAISLAMAGAALLSLSACGAFSLSEEDVTELAQDDVQVVVGQSIGQELAATYAADHIFSLNTVSEASFNPYMTSSAWNKVVGMLVYETLVAEDDTFGAQPNLITAWHTEDGLSWTFTVDTERKFHDGGDMTAADAVYSIERAMGYNARYAARFRDVIGISANDRESFAVTLRTPNFRFYELLNIPCVEYNTGYDDRPPGTGPYAFSASGRYLRLDENHPLAAQMPLETIHLKEYSAAVDILQAFEDSYIDLVINDPTGMSSLGYSSTNIIKFVDTTSLHYIGYNMMSGVFGQSLYRSLVTYAIDRASIVSDVMKGAATAATLPIHPNSALYPADLAQTLVHSEAGLQTALQHLGGVDTDGDGKLEIMGQGYTFDFIVCSDSAMKVSAARAIARQLRECGFDINLRELSYEEYEKALEDGSFDLYYAEVRLCADWDLRPILGSGGDLNYGGLRDATLDGYLQAALASPEEGQADSIAELCQYIAQTAPITAICFEKSEVLYHRGVLSGLSPTQDNIFYQMQNWTVDLD